MSENLYDIILNIGKDLDVSLRKMLKKSKYVAYRYKWCNNKVYIKRRLKGVHEVVYNNCWVLGDVVMKVDKLYMGCFKEKIRGCPYICRIKGSCVSRVCNLGLNCVEFNFVRYDYLYNKTLNKILYNVEWMYEFDFYDIKYIGQMCSGLLWILKLRGWSVLGVRGHYLFQMEWLLIFRLYNCKMAE